MGLPQIITLGEITAELMEGNRIAGLREEVATATSEDGTHHFSISRSLTGIGFFIETDIDHAYTSERGTFTTKATYLVKLGDTLGQVCTDIAKAAEEKADA